MRVIVGTAGWSIPAQDAGLFGAGESVLARYASRFPGVEINSSFYRSHRPATWARWACTVPTDFRFAVKMPRTITHQQKLDDCGDLLTTFLGEVSALERKLAVLLVQLPPKLSFDAPVAATFFTMLVANTTARVVCEPRHASWFGPAADALLLQSGVARVAADPALSPAAALPGGWRGLSYWRLHGSPLRYRSRYGIDRLADYAESLRRERDAGRTAWCIFDNTASSAATGDAAMLLDAVGQTRPAAEAS